MQPDPYANEPTIEMRRDPQNQVPPDGYPYRQQYPVPDAQYPQDAPAQSPYQQAPQGYPVVDPHQQHLRQAVEEEDKAFTFSYVVAKIIDYLRWFLVVLEVALLLRFILKLIGADPTNPFASFLYSLTDVFMFTFKGLVHDPSFGATTIHYFEWTTLIGMLVYGLIFWVLRLFLQTVISRPGATSE